MVTSALNTPSLPPPPSTMQDAVNYVLKKSQKSPVTTLEGRQPAHVGDAVVAVQEAHLQLCEEGYPFSTSIMVTLNVNPETGFIDVPANYLQVQLNYRRYEKWRYQPVIQDGRLRNRVGNTFIFDQDFHECTIVQAVPFEDAPNHARRLSMIRAAISYQADKIGGRTLDALMQQELQRATAVFARAENRGVAGNFFTDSPGMANMRRRR